MPRAPHREHLGPESSFVIPTDLLGAVPTILFSKFPEDLPPSQSQIDEIIFGTDPITGNSTIPPYEAHHDVVRKRGLDSRKQADG